MVLCLIRMTCPTELLVVVDPAKRFSPKKAMFNAAHLEFDPIDVRRQQENEERESAEED